MREEIHKSAPVPPPWREVMRHCDRPADRGAYCASLAQLALKSEVANELPQAFIWDLVVRLSGPQRSLFGCLGGGDLAPLAVNGAEAGLANRVTEIVPRVLAEGRNGRAAVEEAVSLALQERCDSRLRALEGHWLKYFSRNEAAASIRAAWSAGQAIDASELARRLVADGRPNLASPRRPKLDVDADLRVSG